MSKLKLASVILASTDDGRWIPGEEEPRLFILGVDQTFTVFWSVNRHSYDYFFENQKPKVSKRTSNLVVFTFRSRRDRVRHPPYGHPTAAKG